MDSLRLHSVGARRLSESESNSGSVVPFRGDGMMAFTMRPTGLGSGIDKDRPDYTVVAGEWPHLRNTPRSRQSALVLVDDRNGPMTRSDRVAALEEAKAQFQKSWDAWKAWAMLEEVP